jgi:hypothetical protein
VCGNGGGISSLFGSPLIETQHDHAQRPARLHRRRPGHFTSSAIPAAENHRQPDHREQTTAAQEGVFGGAGVWLNAAGSATVRNNVISHNVSGRPFGGCGGYGGAIAIANNLQGTHRRTISCRQ